MRKEWERIKKVLVPSDSIAFVVIILGLLIALFLDELAIRLIGASIVVLGTVALFMMIYQRLSELVTNPLKPRVAPKDYTVTIKKTQSAKRQVFEDFQTAFGKEDTKISTPEKVPEANVSAEEGFRILRKSPKTEIKAAPIQTTPETVEKERIEKPIPAVEVESTSAQEAIISDKAEIIPESQRPAAKFIEQVILDKSVEVPVPKPLTEEAQFIKEAPAFQAKETPEKPHAAELEEIAQPTPPSEKIIEKIETKKEPEEKKIEPRRKDECVDYKEKELDIPISSLMESEPVFGQEPRKEFQYFLSRVLMVIRSVINVRTTAFLIVNSEKGELILESFVTDIPDAIIQKYKFPFGNDIVSQIVKNLKPEILTEINPSAETDLIPYYQKSVGTSSFIGVPVFFNTSVIGILCSDTDARDAYDVNTLGFLGNFTKLIGSLIQSYTEKYDLMQASRTMSAINQFRALAKNQDMTIKDMTAAIADAASQLFEFSMLGICLFDEDTYDWKIKNIRSKNEGDLLLQDMPVDLDKSLLGQSMVSGKTVYLSPLEESSVRFFPVETRKRCGYFISVPLKTQANNFGALFLEGKSPTNMTPYDINMLETFCDHAASGIEQMQMLKMLQFSSVIDPATGLYNPPALYHRLEEELRRSIDFNMSFTFCMLRIDKYASFDPMQYHERMHRVIEHVVALIRKHLRSYDIFGSVDGETFGIILTRMPLNDARIWAERLRSEIATSELKLNTKQFTVTVSMGLAESNKIDNVDDLVANARKVLDISSQKANCVSVFL